MHKTSLVGLPGFKGGKVPTFKGTAIAANPQQLARNTEARLKHEGGLIGMLSLAPGGFGFIRMADGRSYYVSAQAARGYLTGDQVWFELAGEDGRLEAKPRWLAQRSARTWLGEIHRTPEGRHLFVPDEPMGVAVDLENVGFVAPGQVVGIRTSALKGCQPKNRISATISSVLGHRARPGYIQDYALVAHGFSDFMPEAALRQAQQLVKTGVDFQATQVAHERDLRDVPFVTVDGASTEDIDDAIWAKATPDGWHVRIAIANVSHYIQPDSPLDRLAHAQATSVYLPGRMQPMLPSLLSNGLFALQPGEDRRAVVFDVQLLRNGRIDYAAVYPAVIRSAAKLTYGQLAQVLPAVDASGCLAAGISPELREPLLALNAAYAARLAHRAPLGVMDFDDPEPALVQTEEVWRVYWSTRTEAHKLVEQFMILANEVAAQEMLRKFGMGLFRVQPQPLPEAWAEFQAWAATQGFSLPSDPELSAVGRLFQDMTDAGLGAAASSRIRAMMLPAQYVFGPGKGQAHFSLGMTNYTHATSPIRRYSDLLVHRLLLQDELRPEQIESFEQNAEHCSKQATLSRSAERMVWEWYKREAVLQEANPDAEYAAMVLRSSPRGIKVLLTQWQCVAFVPGAAVRALRGEFAEGNWTVAGQVLHIGATLKVKFLRAAPGRPGLPEIEAGLAR